MNLSYNLSAALQGQSGTGINGEALRLRHDVKFPFEIPSDLVVTGVGGPGASVAYLSSIEALQLSSTGDFAKARSRHSWATPGAGVQVIDFITSAFHPETTGAKAFVYGYESDETTGWFGIANGVGLMTWDNTGVLPTKIALYVISPTTGYVKYDISTDLLAITSTSNPLQSQLKWRLVISLMGMTTRISLWVDTATGFVELKTVDVMGNVLGGPYMRSRYQWGASLQQMVPDINALTMNLHGVSVYNVGPSQRAIVPKTHRSGTAGVLFGTSGSKYAVHAVMLTSTRFMQEATLKEWFISPDTATDRYIWEVHLNPTIAGAFAYSVLSGSSLEVAAGVAANTVSADGTIIARGIGYGTQRFSFSQEELNNMMQLGSSWGFVPDKAVLVIIPLQNNSKFLTSFTIEEAV